MHRSAGGRGRAAPGRLERQFHASTAGGPAPRRRRRSRGDPSRYEVVVRTVPVTEPMRSRRRLLPRVRHRRSPPRIYAPGEANWSRCDTVRDLGRVSDDGSAAFAEAGPPQASRLGRGDRGASLLRNAVAQLLREGYVTRVVGSVDPTGHRSYPGVDGEEAAEMLLYAPLVEPAPHPDDPPAKAPIAASTGSTASCASSRPAPSRRSGSCRCTSRSPSRRSSTTPSCRPATRS